MTKNQIEYAKLLELKRSNKAQEGITSARDAESARHNVAAETISLDQLSEVRRSNQSKERETARSNLARERETARANIAQETELKRSNLARETENKRSNIASLNEAIRTHRANEGISSRDVQNRYTLGREGNLVTISGQNVSRDRNEIERDRLSVDKKRTAAQNFESYTRGTQNIVDTVGNVTKAVSMFIGGM
nr:putative ORF1 [Marmot picobirnavirus]